MDLVACSVEEPIAAPCCSGISVTMTQRVTSELFLVSLVVLLLVLIVLLVLFWILKRSRSRNLTELKISAGRPARILTIRTEPDHAHQLLDQLLDRVFLQVEPRPESGEELREEPGAEPGGERGSDSGTDTEVSTAASLPSRAVNTLHDKLWKWITVAIPPPASRSPSPPSSSSANKDQTDGPQRSDASQHASLSSQGASCSSYWEEEQHDESQL